ncbi:2-dehydropantoate 2-reductase (Ketopantoate reductase) (KPA reductase) (KPR) [Sporothrix curviconia]|uniref:2-dehydropantoate 2-reductase (Ketopantoate reductase) (KPA reductase) (KPR) n=1 Tax=Sporothrix curviconia TaxID=1260050 RepID=A0ABP0BEN8_9PEZI
MSASSKMQKEKESTTSAAAVPAWLSQILQDKAPGPKIYRWTPDDVAGSSGAAPQRKKRAPADTNRIFIVGMGNLGRLFAASLARLPDQPPITLVVHRPGLLEQWRAQPGVVLHPQGYVEGAASSKDVRIADFDIEMWSETPPPPPPLQDAAAAGDAEIPPIANLIIATKAQDALRTAEWVRRYLAPDAAVAFAQNGMNKLWPPYGALYNEARYADRKRPPLWLACIVTHGVYSVGPFASVHAAPADVVLGSVDGSISSSSGPGGNEAYLVQQILAASQLKARWAPRHELWVLQLEKLVVNAVINPLTAILRCKNGALFVADDALNSAVLPRVIDQLLQEASAVLRALAQHEIQTGSIFADAASTVEAEADASAALAERLSFASLRAMVYRVGELVKDNSSSMFQDAQAGKKTEVGEFNGWIVDMARYLESVGATDGKTLDVAAHQIMVDLVEKAVPLTQEELGTHFFSRSVRLDL